MCASPESALEQNKELVLRFFDKAWNQGCREAITETFAKTCVLRSGDRQAEGPPAFLHFYDIMRGAFSQISMKPIVCLAQDDLVCVHWSLDCVYTATRTPVRFSGISICRIRDGRFIEAWQSWDAAGLVRQVPGFVVP